LERIACVIAESLLKRLDPFDSCAHSAQAPTIQVVCGEQHVWQFAGTILYGTVNILFSQISSGVAVSSTAKDLLQTLGSFHVIPVSHLTNGSVMVTTPGFGCVGSLGDGVNKCEQ